MNRRQMCAALLAGASLPGCVSRPEAAMAAPMFRFDYSAVDALGAVLQRTSITDAEIDALLANRGVRAMVDNTIKYIPQPLDHFRQAIREHVETRQPTTGRFGLRSAAARLTQAQEAAQAIRAREPELITHVETLLASAWPYPGPIIATCYFVLGGASDGFVLDNDPAPDCFVALDRGEGAADVDGFIVNVAHEFYHVGQKAARRRAGLDEALNVTTAPLLTRLLVSVFDEGSANFAVDPTRFTGTGPYFEMWRDRFQRNAAPDRVTENFALFDRIFSALSTGALGWDEAYREGFGGENDARLYFVGYQMTKLIGAARGPGAVAAAFARPPQAFFRDYVLLSRDMPDAPRFAQDTELQLLARG